MIVTRDQHLFNLRKRLWITVLTLALMAFFYKLYQDQRIISEFSAVGILIKHSGQREQITTPFIEVFTEQGHLKRLQHRDLIIHQAWRAGDSFSKQSGQEQALIAHQLYNLIK